MSQFVFPDEQPRVRVEVNDDGSWSFKYSNITLPEVREVCRRVALWLRMGYLNGVRVERYDLSEGGSVCLVFNRDTRQIQASVNTLQSFDSAILLDNVAAYIDALLFAPHTIPELSELYRK